MILARIFTKIFKEGGIILIDAKGQKYICGNPKPEKPITEKLSISPWNNASENFPFSISTPFINIPTGPLMVSVPLPKFCWTFNGYFFNNFWVDIDLL